MLFRTAATSAAILLGLAAAGALAGPGWDPVPVSNHIRPASPDTMIGGAAGGFGGLPGPGTFEVRETRVEIELDDGASVSGLLREPGTGDRRGTGSRPGDARDTATPGGPGDPEPVSGEPARSPASDDGDGRDDRDGAIERARPGVVFVHGAGTGKASDAFTEAATALASAGIVTLVPDKYLANYTTRHRDYLGMAEDYRHSVDFLRSTPGVDPERVGLYAESEGCWVAPVMAARDQGLAFQVWVSAPVVPPRQQAAYAMDNYLRNTAVPAGVFRAIPRAVGMRLPGGGFEYADFDVGPWLARQTGPILMAYGATDPSMPMEQAVRRVLADTAAGGEAPVTARFYGGANHGINVSDEPLGDAVVPHGDGLHLHPAFARDVATWINALPEAATARPRIAGADPRQLYLAAPVPQPQWYGNGDVVLGVVAGAAVLLVAGGVLLTVARSRARLAAGLGEPLAVLAGATVATAGGLVWYLLTVARLAQGYLRNDVVVQGGWIGVRLLGIVAVVAAAVLVLRCRRVRWQVVDRPAEGRRVSDDGRVARPLVTVAFWAVALGAVVLGLVLAYWGVYQLGV